MAPVVAAVAMLAACQGHTRTTATGPTGTPSVASSATGSPCNGFHSCPFAGPSVYANSVTTIDGKRALFRPVTRVAFGRTHHVAITMHFLHSDTPITSWQLGEGFNWLKGTPLLAHGTSLDEGQVITLDWRPRLTGQRALTLVIHSAGGETSSSVLDVQVYGGTTLRVVDDCTHPAVKPRRIAVACGDGAERLEGVRYDTWDRTAAYGTATVVANDFKPDRAHGHEHRYPAHIRLSAVREFPEGPRFTVLRITFDGPTPYGQRVETTPV